MSCHPVTRETVNMAVNDDGGRIDKRVRLSEQNVREMATEQASKEGARVRVVFDDEIPSFAVRISPKGAATFCMVYSMGGVSHAYTLGKFRTPEMAKLAPGAGRGMTATEARRAALLARARIEAGENIAQRKASAKAAAKEEKEAMRKAAAVKKDREAATFGLLMQTYSAYLREAGRASWRQVDGAVRRHLESRKALYSMPASEVEIEHVMPVLADLIKDGKQREAEKLRAYIRTAYALARRASTDAALHMFAGFRLRANPLADLAVSRTKETAERAAKAAKERKWALSEAELAAYWLRISAMQTPIGAALRFHLLTGGQRVEQLARLEIHDYDAQQKTITLRDTKGRRSVAYDHVVPLIPDAERALDAMRGGKGGFLFSVSGGRYGAVYHTIRAAIVSVAEDMLEAGDVSRVFTPGIIRKTVETRLQAAGVSRDVRAHLLSHGQAGVQAKHYEAHEFDDEKRAALRKLRSLCDPKGKPGNVTPIRRKA